MDATTFTARLGSVAQHLERHPGLADGISNILVADYAGDGAEIQALIFDHRNGHISELAAWARTLKDTTAVTIRTTEGHVGLIGRAADGTAISIRTVLNSGEIDLLVANDVVVKADATFSIELLLKLAGPGRQLPDRELADAATVDEQIDGTPDSGTPSLSAQVMWAEAGLAVLGAFLRDARPCQDEPINPAHTAELEQAIGRPIPDTDLIGGGA